MPSDHSPLDDLRKQIQEALLKGIKSLPDEKPENLVYYRDRDGQWHKGSRPFVNGTFVTGMAYQDARRRYRETFHRKVPVKPLAHLPVHAKTDLLREALGKGKPIPEHPVDRIELVRSGF